MDAKYPEWLAANFQPSTRSTQLSQSRRIEEAYGDLDELYHRDRFTSTLADLSYTDRASAAPNKSKIPVHGQRIYEALAHLRSAIGYYRRFRERDGGLAARMNRDALEQLRQDFLKQFPGFGEGGDFQAKAGPYWLKFRQNHQDLIAKTIEIIRSGAEPKVLGGRLFEIARSSSALHSGIRNRMPLFRRTGLGRVEEAVTQLVLSMEPPAVAADSFVKQTWSIMVQAHPEQPYRDSRAIPSCCSP